MRDLRIQWLDSSLKVDLLELEPCFRERVAKYHHPFAKEQSFAAYALLQEMLKATHQDRNDHDLSKRKMDDQ